jgi:hypothetical protein
MPQIYATLDNKQDDHQASVVEMEGMIANHLVSILIDPGSNLSYMAPRTVDKCKLQPVRHVKPWLAIDPNKIRSIMEWPTPKDVSDIIFFMVLAGYYRRSIKIFSHIGCPIISLQTNGVKFTWTSECEERFQELK